MTLDFREWKKKRGKVKGERFRLNEKKIYIYLVHVLVYNLEKTALCPPIPLKEIQDMFERNGVIAGLQKWDICMVPFGVEGKMHRALIVELSGKFCSPLNFTLKAVIF